MRNKEADTKYLVACNLNKISPHPHTPFTVCLCSLNTEKLLLKNHLESLSFLTRSNTLVDEKTVQAKLGDYVSLKLLNYVVPCVFVPALLIFFPLV